MIICKRKYFYWTLIKISYLNKIKMNNTKIQFKVNKMKAKQNRPKIKNMITWKRNRAI